MARVSMVPEVVFIEVVGIGDFFGIIANRETIGLFHLRLRVSVTHLRPAFILGPEYFCCCFSLWKLLFAAPPMALLIEDSIPVTFEAAINPTYKSQKGNNMRELNNEEVLAVAGAEGSVTDVVNGAASGAATGAAIGGAYAGPVGSVAGAFAGAIYGGISAYFA